MTTKSLIYTLEVMERTKLRKDKERAQRTLDMYLEKGLISLQVYNLQKGYIANFKTTEKGT